MRTMQLTITLCSIVIATGLSQAEPAYKSHYQGQEKRTIKSLSEEDIRQLQSGEGWGLAKAAELNGMPGPAHVLQMKREINLSPEQEQKIHALFEQMKAKAVPLGRKLVELEAKLNASFANKSITDTGLKQQLMAIAEVRKQLRYVHLESHLKTPEILTPEQIEQYIQLRGYDNADPCQNIPEGHNAEMWKMHNGCK